jgi:hypothetical protein
MNGIVDLISPPLGRHYHDGDVLQNDGINSNGGAFAFDTTGPVAFNQQVNFTGGIGNGGSPIDINDNIDMNSNDIININFLEVDTQDNSTLAEIGTYCFDTTQGGYDRFGGPYQFYFYGSGLGVGMSRNAYPQWDGVTANWYKEAAQKSFTVNMGFDNFVWRYNSSTTIGDITDASLAVIANISGANSKFTCTTIDMDMNGNDILKVTDITNTDGAIAITANTTLTLEAGTFVWTKTGAGQHMYIDCGGNFLWRDVDGGSATRMTLESANGNLHLTGNLYLNGNQIINVSVITGGGSTIQFNDKALFTNKIAFTQVDENEYIDSLNDGYMDYGATIGHRFNATIHSNGGRIVNTTRQTGAYTALVTDHAIYGDTDGGAWTLDLPAGVDGQMFMITNCGSSGNDLTVDGDGAEEINGALTQILSDEESIIIIFETTEGWRIF